MFTWLIQLFCGHDWRVAFREQTYGYSHEHRRMVDGERTLWVCHKCKKTRVEATP